jgi:hypothetical protein
MDSNLTLNVPKAIYADDYYSSKGMTITLTKLRPIEGRQCSYIVSSIFILMRMASIPLIQQLRSLLGLISDK